MKFFRVLYRNNNGQLLIELLVAMALSAILIPALATGLIASKQGTAQQSQRAQAVALLKEAEEVVRSVREKDWSNFAVPNGTVYHPSISGNAWSFIPSAESINGFSRSIVISDVFRDANGVVVTSGGTLDPSTKQVVALVTWEQPYNSSVTSTLYVTRFLKNAANTQTTIVDFNAGTTTNTVVTNTNGGEVVLGAGGGGDWCSPNLSITALDLPKNGVANAITTIEGRAFAGTGDNAAGESFNNIDISNTDPPVASILGTFSNYKTNDVFGESNYGYIATDTNSKEIIIVNLTTNPYSEAGYFDAPGNTDANSVFIVGDTGYMTQGNRLRNFSLATCSGGNRSGSCPAIDSDGVAISATGTSVVVSGNYAFVSISGHARELEIFDLSNPSSLTPVGWADVNGEAATDVFVNSTATRAYVVTNASATLPELFIINVSNKTCSDCPDIGTYNAGTSVNLKAVEVVPGNRAILVGQGGEEYQVINISTETDPARCGGMQINSGINDAASVLESDGDAYSYIVTRDTTSELKIIEGGPGGQFATSGTFISSAFDAGATVAYNRLIPSFIQPDQTTIQFQIAVASAVSGSCSGATYYFVGPDGTSSTYFTSAGAIPLITNGGGYVNPGQCIKYKAYFSTSDYVSSPILNDVSVNYSP